MYRLELSHSAHRQISRLPAQTQERVNRAIAGLAENPRPPGTKKRTAREGYRVRVGDYRVLYRIDDDAKVVTIYRVRSEGMFTGVRWGYTEMLREAIRVGVGIGQCIKGSTF